VSAWLDSLGIVAPAFAAGLLVLATHVPLGHEVLRRGIVFLDIAIAQIAALGVILAALLGWDDTPWMAQAIAVGSALAGGWLLHLSEQRFAEVQEAIIGVAFVLAACVALLLVAGNPHGAEHITDLLSGQILWVSGAELLPLAAVTVVILLLWWPASPLWRRRLFYPLFAVAITASVQLVGVYLVFSSLIIPALAVRGMTRRPLLTAGMLGALAYALGLLLSIGTDLPAGPLIVCCLVALTLLLVVARRFQASSL